MSWDRYDKLEPDLFLIQAYCPDDEDGHIETYAGTDDVDRAHELYHQLCKDMAAMVKAGIMANDIVVQLALHDGRIEESTRFSIREAKAILQ